MEQNLTSLDDHLHFITFPIYKVFSIFCPIHVLVTERISGSARIWDPHPQLVIVLTSASTYGECGCYPYIWFQNPRNYKHNKNTTRMDGLFNNLQYFCSSMERVSLSLVTMNINIWSPWEYGSHGCHFQDHFYSYWQQFESVTKLNILRYPTFDYPFWTVPFVWPYNVLFNFSYFHIQFIRKAINIIRT